MNGSLALFFFDFAIFENLFQGKYLGRSLTYAGAALHVTARISKGLWQKKSQNQFDSPLPPLISCTFRNKFPAQRVINKSLGVWSLNA